MRVSVYHVTFTTRLKFISEVRFIWHGIFDEIILIFFLLFHKLWFIIHIYLYSKWKIVVWRTLNFYSFIVYRKNYLHFHSCSFIITYFFFPPNFHSLLAFFYFATFYRTVHQVITKPKEIIDNRKLYRQTFSFITTQFLMGPPTVHLNVSVKNIINTTYKIDLFLLIFRQFRF